MKKAVIYIHGKGGSAEESEHYVLLFDSCDVIGMEYNSLTPWEAKNEFSAFFDKISEQYDSVVIVANSIGAFFTMNALPEKTIEKAYFISPVVDMESLIKGMMYSENITEEELRDKKEISTKYGETLSWEYLCYVRQNPIEWNVPTAILYGENDNLTSFEEISDFAKKTDASLTVMPGGEHRFHTEQQMTFLDSWIAEEKA